MPLSCKFLFCLSTNNLGYMGEYIKTFVHQKHTDHMHTQGRHNGCSSRNPLPDPKGFNYKLVPVYTIERGNSDTQ